MAWLLCRGGNRALCGLRPVCRCLSCRVPRAGREGIGMKKKHWYDYFWVWSILYFALGFFNILFAWLGMLDFFLPLGLALFGGNKFFCNHLCGRGQLFSKLGKEGKCSRNQPTPRWMSSRWFRYAFWSFFWRCSGTCSSRPTWWELEPRRSGRPSSSFGRSGSRGAGRIRQGWSRTGWRSSASVFMGLC